MFWRSWDMLETLWKKILRRRPFSLLAIPALLLWLASLVYRVLFLLYRATRGQPIKLSVPVISVGSISVGGAGKTPLVERIARGLQEESLRVGIVSLGYGRMSRKSLMLPGYQVQDLDWVETGDEVQLLARQLPEALFSVDESKTAAATKLAESGEVDVVVLDDGFQHFTLARDLDVVAYDASLKPRLLKLFPYGVLREPRHALLKADIIIVTRAKFARDISKLRERLGRISPNSEIFHAGFTSEVIANNEKRLPVKYLEDKSVFLFAGVGNFRSLRKQVFAMAADVDYALELSDHQVYDERLLSRIRELVKKHDSDIVLTTGKDWVKLAGFDFERETYYLDLIIDLDPGEEKLIRRIVQRLDLKRWTE